MIGQKIYWPDAHYHLKNDHERGIINSIRPRVRSVDITEWSNFKHHLTTNDLDNKNISKDYFCLGIHPWWAQKVGQQEITKVLIEGLAHPQNVGLGEIGLDGGPKYREHFQAQLQCLEFVINFLFKEKLMTKVGTIVWHAVSAWEDVAVMIRKIPNNLVHIIHDYSGSAEWANSICSSNNCYFSLSPRIYKSAKRQQIIKHIDCSKLLLESDDFSEEESYPLMELSAQCLGLSQEKWQKQVYDNFFRAYPRI